MSEPRIDACKLDHVGIAAEGPSSPLVSLLGNGTLEAKEMPSGVSVARFGPDLALELVWPRTTSSPIRNFLTRRGPALHHLAVAVDVPLTELMAQLAATGVRFAGGIEPSSDGRPSLFVHPSGTGGVLIELVEGGR